MPIQVLLIDPNPGQKNSRPQLGSLHLAAMLLQQGYRVKLIDRSLVSDDREIIDQLCSEDLLCVGVSTIIGPMLLDALTVSALVRTHRPDIPIVWGGVFPTIAPQETIGNECVDAICIGEGEITFPLMIRAYQDRSALSEIPGIAYKEKGEVIYTPPRTDYFDLDQLPLLPFHLADLDGYAAANLEAGGFEGMSVSKAVSIETTRGCPYRCSYCVNAATNSKYRRMSSGKVIEHLAHIHALGYRGVTINDDNFFIDKKRARNTLKMIADRELDIQFFVAIRADYLAKLDDDGYQLMKRAGIRMLGLGIESASEDVLRSINKRESVADMYEASHRLARHGIKAWFHFIYAFPEETEADFIETFNAMQRICRVNPYALANLNRLIPNPGTPSLDKCVEKGYPRPKTLQQWATITEDIHAEHPAYLDKALERWRVKYANRIRFPTNNPIRDEVMRENLDDGYTLTVGEFPIQRQEYVRRAWTRLGHLGPDNRPLRIAVFGAGAHSRWLEKFVVDMEGPEVVAVLDEMPEERVLWGRTVIKPESLDASNIDAIFISTNSKNDLFYAKCRSYFGVDCRIVDFYRRLKWD